MDADALLECIASLLTIPKLWTYTIRILTPSHGSNCYTLSILGGGSDIIMRFRQSSILIDWVEQQKRIDGNGLGR